MSDSCNYLHRQGQLWYQQNKRDNWSKLGFIGVGNPAGKCHSQNGYLSYQVGTHFHPWSQFLDDSSFLPGTDRTGLLTPAKHYYMAKQENQWRGSVWVPCVTIDICPVMSPASQLRTDGILSMIEKYLSMKPWAVADLIIFFAHP